MMEEEIRHHQNLLDEIRREAVYIRENSAEALLQSVHAIGEHAKAIASVQRNIQQKVKGILVSSGMDPDADSLKSFFSLLPSADGRKMRMYQNSLERLKKWILEINQRNKSFIQDSLSYWKELFSMATGLRQQFLVYVQNGQKKTSVYQPLSLDRKV
jgi:hypothetical protein